MSLAPSCLSCILLWEHWLGGVPCSCRRFQMPLPWFFYPTVTNHSCLLCPKGTRIAGEATLSKCSEVEQPQVWMGLCHLMRCKMSWLLDTCRTCFFSFYFQLNFKLEVHSNLLDYPPRTSYVVFAVTEECPSVIGSSLYIGDASDRHFIGISRLFSFSVWRPWGGIDRSAIFV